jgi:hypothetical protein
VRDRLRPLPPPVDSEFMWRKLLNALYVYEQDELFVWVKRVREEIARAEKKDGGRSGAA